MRNTDIPLHLPCFEAVRQIEFRWVEFRVEFMQNRGLIVVVMLERAE
jgi:hypothetical protein